MQDSQVENSFPVNTWIIDLGASDHIICNEHLFSHVNKGSQSPISVRLPNGNITYVTKTGTIHLGPNFVLCAFLILNSPYSLSQKSASIIHVVPYSISTIVFFKTI